MNAPLHGNETGLKGRIVRTLNGLFPDSRFWVANSGGRTRRSVQSPPGTPDILGYLAPRGLFIGIECKMPGKKSSPIQIDWHVHAATAGALITVAYSVEEAVLFVSKAREL